MIISKRRKMTFYKLYKIYKCKLYPITFVNMAWSGMDDKNVRNNSFIIFFYLLYSALCK